MRSNPESLEYTGAKINDIVGGLEPVNRGIRIRLKQDQARGYGNQLVGRFQLLEVGDGEYSEFLKAFAGQTHTSKDFIELLLERINPTLKKPLKVLHIFNCNMLGVDKNAT